MSKRFWLIPPLAICLALAAFGIWQASQVSAQNEPPKKGPDTGLPIKQVVLFNTGLGYFQREGEVEGNARIDLSFPFHDINDLLKSLILQDSQGRIGTVNYDSHDPINKILRSFALDLNNNPTFGQILNQARGEAIEVTRQTEKNAPARTIGNIVGVEVQQRPAKDGIVHVEMLNMSTAQGLQSIPLEQVVSVKFQNPTLESEFQRALRVLASAHDTQKKTVSVGFTGDGKRQVRVGYVVERPIWKTTYRLRLDPNGKLSIQGWGLVENTSDDDWNDIRMVLVSGKPISFKMNLYEPLYIPRPEVEPEQFASLRPPVYGGAMEGALAGAPVAPMAPMGPPVAGMMPGMSAQGGAGFGRGGEAKAGPGGGGGGFGGYGGVYGNLGGRDPAANAPKEQMLLDRLDAQQQQLRGVNQLNNNQLGNRLSYDEFQRRRAESEAAQKDAKKAGSAIAGFNFKEGIQSVATAEEVGDYFQYVIDQKISLARQKSAMLPILDQVIDGYKVSIFNETVHNRYPLLGLRLKNTSGQPLTQGPITVYDSNVYAGDTRILDLQPNEERLLSYALDQGTEVKTATKDSISPDMNLRFDTTQLTAKFNVRQTRTYALKNRSPHDRQVILEHPIRGDWKLVEPNKPAEKTRDLYRFQLAVASTKNANFEVIEEQARVDAFALHTGQPVYPAAIGIAIRATQHAFAQKLVGLRIEKGVAHARMKTKESKTYFVQNNSEIERNFTVDHVVRPEWVRVDDKGQNQNGPAVFRVQLKVDKGKTGQQEIVEEHVMASKGVFLKQVGEEMLRLWINDPAPSADVKAALNRVLTFDGKVVLAKAQVVEFEKQLKALSDDQSRLRDNLKIIPPTSEHYKKFLEKFVGQETEIETLQREIRKANVAVATVTRDYDTYLATLNAE